MLRREEVRDTSIEQCDFSFEMKLKSKQDDYTNIYILYISHFSNEFDRFFVRRRKHRLISTIEGRKEGFDESRSLDCPEGT